MKPELEKVFKEIVQNFILRQAILHPEEKHDEDAFFEGCKNFAQYQRDLCKEKGLDFNQEGFMVGSPWHGDIEKAPVLFLSSNPAITLGSCFPRWHPSMENPAKDKFSLGGMNSDGLSKHKNFINISDVQNFFTNRFQETAISDKGLLNVWMIGKDGGLYPKCNKNGRRTWVHFWNFMRRTLAALFDMKETASSEKSTKYLMQHALSTEIIPFGSMDQKGVHNTLMRDYCWERFVTPILEHCKARIFILIGSVARNDFCNFITKSYDADGKAVLEKLKARESIYLFPCGGIERKVVAIPHPRASGNTIETCDFFKDLQEELKILRQ